jgi:diamine N-acetyltransferase
VAVIRVTLASIDRNNWLAALDLRIRPEQQRFVATPLFSLAGAFVRRWGYHFVYSPQLISSGTTPVGFVCTVCDPTSTDEYWIDDILIDARHQGRGYGHAAMLEVIRYFLREYPRCDVIKLSCHAENTHAARLYVRLGFQATGQLNPESGHPNYELPAERLNLYRDG